MFVAGDVQNDVGFFIDRIARADKIRHPFAPGVSGEHGASGDVRFGKALQKIGFVDAEKDAAGAGDDEIAYRVLTKRAAAGGEDQSVRGVEEAAERVQLAAAESNLSFCREQFGDGCSRLCFDDGVDVQKWTAKPFAKQYAEGRFSRAHHADKDDLVGGARLRLRVVAGTIGGFAVCPHVLSPGAVMNANSFGRLFTFTTWGESHGPALGCVVDGCPARVPLSEGDIQPLLDRRRPGRNAVVTPRNEADQVRILSGVFEGLTTGHPISLIIENTNQRSTDYQAMRDVFRPGHADATHYFKYGHRDPRGGGRSSARETAARVAAGGVAYRVLAHFPETRDVRIRAGVVALGGVRAERWDESAIDGNPFFCPDPEAAARMEAELATAREAGDSLGGIVEVRVSGAPAGLGEPMYDKLDARIGAAFLGLNAVKGVEIGEGFAAALLRGSENNDAMRGADSGKLGDAFVTNHAGGVLGGISTGGEIVVRCGFKPTPSVGVVQETVDVDLRDRELGVGGRHDPAVCIRAVPVLEGMMAAILADFLLLARSRDHLAGAEPVSR